MSSRYTIPLVYDKTRTLHAYIDDQEFGQLTALPDYVPEGVMGNPMQYFKTTGDIVSWIIGEVDRATVSPVLSPDEALRLATDLAKALIEWHEGGMTVLGYEKTVTLTQYNLIVTALPASDNWNLVNDETDRVITRDSDEAKHILASVLYDFRNIDVPQSYAIEAINAEYR